jgi:hypothetical protein
MTARARTRIGSRAGFCLVAAVILLPVVTLSGPFLPLFLLVGLLLIAVGIGVQLSARRRTGRRTDGAEGGGDTAGAGSGGFAGGGGDWREGKRRCLPSLSLGPLRRARA